MYLTGTEEFTYKPIYTVEEVAWEGSKSTIQTDTSLTTTDGSAVTEYIDEVLERYLEPAKLSEMMLDIL